MATVRLGDHSLGGGASVVDLTFEITTRQVAARAETERAVIGKPLAGDGEIGFTATARFSTRGTTPEHLFGIKQIALLRGGTAEYSGLKNIDGSITEGTSTLNFTPTLDLAVFLDAPTSALVAPHAPFYSESPALVRPGAQIELTVKDAPGGSYAFKRRNNITDRQNFLDSINQDTQFATFLVVQMPDRSHLALAGFKWSFLASADVRWIQGKPTVSGAANHVFQTAATRADLSQAELEIFEDRSLAFPDSIVAKVNKAMFAARAQHAASPVGPGAPAKIDGGGFAIDQFPQFNNARANSAKAAL
ncbi:MAG: hypothetical protein H0T56_09845 [Pseudaminobacter sp.]|nr:hypothetical protein [Pseudaminobacter sp.]